MGEGAAMIGFVIGFITGAIFDISATILVLVPEFNVKFGGRDD
jgi:hypothetical protein